MHGHCRLSDCHRHCAQSQSAGARSLLCLVQYASNQAEEAEEVVGANGHYQWSAGQHRRHWRPSTGTALPFTQFPSRPLPQRPLQFGQNTAGRETSTDSDCVWRTARYGRLDRHQVKCHEVSFLCPTVYCFCRLSLSPSSPSPSLRSFSHRSIPIEN